MMSMLSDTVQVRKGFPKWVLPAFGYALSAISLIWVLKHTPLRESADHLRHLNWMWVTLAFACEVGSNIFHGLRWRLILLPAEKAPLWRCVQSVMIGLFASQVLPAKAGEVIRGYLLTHWTKVHLPLSISSVAIETVIDGIWLVVIFFLATMGMANLPKDLVRGAWALAIGVALLSVLFLYLLFHKQHSYQVVQGHPRFSRFLHFLDELHKMGQVRTLLAGFGVSFFYILLQAISTWALLHADQYDFNLVQAAAILLVFRIGTLVPSAPANIGMLQYFTYLGVRLVGGEGGPAFGEVNFIFITLARLIQGGVAILLTGINLQEVRAGAQSAHRRPMGTRRAG